MSASGRAYATMITNFDSTEQRGLWERIADDLRAGRSVPGWDRLWFKNRTIRVGERLLNDYPEFATRFAGIIRTAYLYCPMIMLTDAQLFDGVFFLALGPRTVNGIVGTSYKDGPAIIVSGRSPTLEGCLLEFTVRTVGDVRRSRPDLACAGDDDQYTIRPLEYSALGGVTVTAEDALGLDADAYRTFTEELRQADDASSAPHAHDGDGKAGAIARMMARVLRAKADGAVATSDGRTDATAGTRGTAGDDVADRCRFLGERWREWIDAEREGLVLYENQRDPAVQARVRSAGFDHYLRQYGSAYAAGILEHCGLPASAVETCRSEAERMKRLGETMAESGEAAETRETRETAESQKSRETREARETLERRRFRERLLADLPKTDTMDTRGKPFLTVLADVLDTPKRSDAFALIARSDLPDAPRDGFRYGQCCKRLLHDWYQLVYQQTMATHLGAQLIAVDIASNSVEQIVGRSSRGASLMLAGDITRILGGMPYIRFATFCYESRGTIARWRDCTPDDDAASERDGTDRPRARRRLERCGRWLLHDVLRMDRNQRATHNVAYAVEQAGEEKSLVGDAKSLLFGGGVAAALAFVSAMADNVWFDNHTPIWILVGVAWVVGIVPNIIDAVQWLRGVYSSATTVVYMG
ncbi:hypothetical protein JS531_10145 [Bifidobacterium sp. CP2]|uniref:hypothetical protein n=1 Tax=Bifidobacterium sp. CP2 TaxID=2809025 RepID=UPI001BDD8709|nr:hypothetical protein [Bifidobacterium sp. CP2]MBT1182297.1 hypothetical protein [Bifidobacterium sp. CP2]